MRTDPRERLVRLLNYVEQVIRLDEKVVLQLSNYRLPDGTAFAFTSSEPSGDITGCHPAVITPSTIIPPHSGERLDLHLAIWICFTNARNQAKRRQDPETQARCT